MVRRTRKQSRRQSRRQRKQQGGDNAPANSNSLVVEEKKVLNVTENKQQGGKRKSRKLSPWNKFVQKIYREMKGKNKSATFSQALKEASKRKKEM